LNRVDVRRKLIAQFPEAVQHLEVFVSFPNFRLMMPARPDDATPSSALIRRCVRGRTICLATPG
jgi:hypothetical protein